MPMKPLAPSFGQQRQLDLALRAYFCRLNPIGGISRPPLIDVEALVRATLIGLAADMGENFWRRMTWEPRRERPPPERPPQVSPTARFIWLGDGERREAEAALWFGKLHAIPSVIAALRAHTTQCEAARVAPIIKECVAEWFSEKSAAGIMLRNRRCLQWNLNPFIDAFGEKRPGELSAEEISRFLIGDPNPLAVRVRARNVSAFFSWAIRRQYAVENPVPLTLRSRPQSVRPVLVFTPRQARFILRRTRHTDQIAFWVLSFFGGLRTTEIQRIDGHPAPWSLIRFRVGKLDVPGRESGAVDRSISMLPVLRDWLAWIRPRSVPFFPPNFWEKKFPLAWRTAFRKFPDGRTSRTGYRKPEFPRRVPGMARGTHITYRLAMRGATLEEVARDTGDTVKLTRLHHDVTMKPRRARDFFALSPENI